MKTVAPVYEQPPEADNRAHTATSEAGQSPRTLTYLWGVQEVEERRGGSGHLLVAAATPWLVRWLLLRGSGERFGPPGTPEKVWIHVRCFQPGCDTDDWVTKYERSTVRKCSDHRPQLPRLPLERCLGCPKCTG